jgi:hypothetical protein
MSEPVTAVARAVRMTEAGAAVTGSGAQPFNCRGWHLAAAGTGLFPNN